MISPFAKRYRRVVKNNRKGVINGHEDITPFLKNVSFVELYSIGEAEISVGLPIYNSLNICWIALESLCRQVTKKKWELVVFETGEDRLGKEWFSEYEERLKQAGCVKIKYGSDPLRFPLSIKWIIISEQSQGYGMLLQAADCYSYKERIEETANALLKADWFDVTKGVFYNINTKQCIIFDSSECLTGLHMAINTGVVRQMKKSIVRKGVDGHLLSYGRKMKPDFNTVQSNKYWNGSIDSDGLNNISFKRALQYENPVPPFYKTDLTIDSILPADIAEKLKQL